MAEYIINAETLAGIAKAIRSKTYNQAPLTGSAFAEEIEKIKIGEIPEGMVKPYGTLYLSREGDFDVTGYATVATRNVVPSTPLLKYLSRACYGVEYGMYYEVTGDIVLAAAEGSMRVNIVADGAFKSNYKITGVTIPEGYTDIYSEAFADCQNLEYVQLPKTLTTIGSDAFKDCIKLNSVSLPPQITNISPRTFSGCTRLNTVFIPNGVTSIGEDAFRGCKRLPTIYLPLSIEEIGANAFAETNISAIYTARSPGNWSSVVLGENWAGGTVPVYCKKASGVWEEMQ